MNDIYSKRVFQIVSSVELMSSFGRLRFLTLTVPDNDLPLKVLSERFRSFTNSRWWRKLTKSSSKLVNGKRVYFPSGHEYIAVYEPHPSGHGWHIHIITNFFVPKDQLDIVSSSYLFGITDVRICDSNTAYYIAKYVTKTNTIRKLSEKNVRIVNVSRSLITLSDIVVHSPSIDFIRSRFRSYDGDFFIRSLFLYILWLHSIYPSFDSELLVLQQKLKKSLSSYLQSI